MYKILRFNEEFHGITGTLSGCLAIIAVEIAMMKPGFVTSKQSTLKQAIDAGFKLQPIN
jgi:hypothetical protein